MISRMRLIALLLLESPVAHRKGLVDDEYLGVDGNSERKAQTRFHTARVCAHRLVDVQAELGKLDDPGFEVAYLRSLQAEDLAAQVDILPPRQLGVENPP